MSTPRLTALTTLALLAFAANSLLCRLALQGHHIDASRFTALRLGSGALMLAALGWRRDAPDGPRGSWLSALALFAYAAGFSFAYLSLPTATGALLLFGAVQASMMSVAIARGTRFAAHEWVGFVLALAGLVGLLAPGLSAPAPGGALVMLGAGVAWGVYSLRGRGAGDATRVTAGNFLRAAPMALALGVWNPAGATADVNGVVCAVASGALASGLGYAVWYTVLPNIRATHAAIVQLSVPVIAAIGGYAFLGEPVTVRLGVAAAAILGGIAMVVAGRRAG